LEKAKQFNYDLIRHCTDCNENVYLVHNEEELLLMIEQNKCVSIPFDITNTHKQMSMPLMGSLKLKYENNN